MSDPTRVPDRLYAGYVFDLDGTIYLGAELLPGAERLVQALRDMDSKVVFVSNNPTRDPEEYARKLTDLGLTAQSSDVINTVVTTTSWLAENAAPKPCPLSARSRSSARYASAASGCPKIRARLTSSSPATTGSSSTASSRSHSTPSAGPVARLIATNPDRFCPFPDGHGEPDAAAITAAIEACTETACELHFGKPGPVMLHAIAAALELSPEGATLPAIG